MLIARLCYLSDYAMNLIVTSLLCTNAAKKQRTIQMVDPQNLPKQGNNRNFQPSGKPRNNSNINSNRNWSR